MTALLVCLLVGANPPVLTDFANGVRVEAQGGGPVYNLDLPEEVYGRSVRADLGDLRLFNAAHQPVPHALGKKDDSLAPPRWVDVPLFPLRGRADQPIEAVQVTVERRGDKITVATKNPKAAGAIPIVGYLLDLSLVQEDVDRLRLAWESTPANLIARLTLARSPNLDYFDGLGSAAIAELHQGGQSILRAELAFASVRQGYLRLAPQGSGVMPVVLTGAKVRVVPSRSAPEPRWVSLTPQGAAAADGWHYESPIAAPFDRVQLGFVNDNTVVRAVLSFVEGEPAAPVVAARGLFYRLGTDGEAVENEPESFGTRRQRHWQVRLESGSLADTEAPTLRLGYVPERLWFVAKGEGPFTLAYGSGRVGPDGLAVDELAHLSADASTTAWVTGSEEVLGGPSALEDPETRAKHRRTGMLWAVLVVGLLGLTFMAVRLVRELRKEPPTTSPPGG